ncbi:unnamed protein product [Leptidea sinapis]|uniref:Uncharacterized protein n=1 Tax=Leptidea sinapis TaxID=189913 RepID=A0A5E4QES9_9NEOP|nr:unnamed protein product [Leptidea sinapis]
MNVALGCIVVLLNFHAVLSNQELMNFVSQTYQNVDNPPIIILLDTKTKEGKIYDFLANDSEDRNENDSGEGDPNVLARLLSQDDYSSDRSDKEMLRAALRIRCKRLNKCQQMCPIIETTCTFTCKQMYDSSDMCEPRPKKPQCCPPGGKTMPPRWLL